MHEKDIAQTIKQALQFRHACKEFNPTKKIPENDFNLLLEVAQLSHSSFGLEPWKLILVNNKKKREALLEHTWGGAKQIPTASHLLLIWAKKTEEMKHDAPRITQFMREIQHHPEDLITQRIAKYKKFQEEDFELLESERALFDWSAKQTYIMLGNLMHSAAMLGIDSCAIEGFHAQKIEATMQQEFGMDKNRYGLSVMLALGYRVHPPKEKTRQPLSELLTIF